MDASKIYEDLFGIYDQNFSVLFDSLNRGGYANFVLIFLVVPFVCWLLFYFAWRYPYGRAGHYYLWLVLISAIVGLATYGIANKEIFSSRDQQLIDALADPASNYQQYASGLLVKYSVINAGISLLVGFVCSLIMKHFSKIQVHLPF